MLLLWILMGYSLESKCFHFESMKWLRDVSNDTNSIEFDNGTFEEAPDIDQAFFGGLDNFQVNAVPRFDQSLYIARVIHSTTQAYPFVCTCTCIEPRIFITAARCIRSLKAKHTSVYYLEKHLLLVQAFIIPSEPSKQYYQDIGLIVVEDAQFIKIWSHKTVESPINMTKSFTDWENDFKDKLWSYGSTPTFGILGFAAEKHMYRAKDHRIEYKRYFAQELLMSTDYCFEMLGKKQIEAYKVPCLLPCPPKELKKGDEDCKTQLAAEGGLVYGYIKDESWSYSIGVATWGVSSVEEYAMPVGFAVINTKKYWNNYKCALKILDDTLEDIKLGYLQKLCNKSSIIV